MLLEFGHTRAARYPMWQVWLESEIVIDRHNSRMVTEAVLIQGAVSSLFEKESAKHFKELLESMTDGQ